MIIQSLNFRVKNNGAFSSDEIWYRNLAYKNNAGQVEMQEWRVQNLPVPSSLALSTLSLPSTLGSLLENPVQIENYLSVWR